jgi:prepilin-type processing-associated H-X9-DG protein
MISQRLKDLCFSAVLPVTYINHCFWRVRLNRKLSSGAERNQNGKIWLNIGSGTKNYGGFVNIDGNIFSGPGMWLDLRNGLPFPTATVDAIYASHVLEHFYYREVTKILRECYRVLRPGGGLRMLVPSVELAIEAYRAGNGDWFSDFPTNFDSVGGRFMNFLFCDGQHRLAFDLSFAEELLKKSGFCSVDRMRVRLSRIFPGSVLEELEPAANGRDALLVVEARRTE